MPKKSYGRRSFARKSYGAGRRKAGGWPKKAKRAPSALKSTGNLAGDQVVFISRRAELFPTALTMANVCTPPEPLLNGICALAKGAYVFQLNDLPSFGELVALFQWYKFGYVELTFTIVNSAVATNPGSNNPIVGNATLYAVTDGFYGNNAFMTTDLDQMTNLKAFPFDMNKGGTVKVKLRPAVQTPVAIAGGGYAPVIGAGRPWLATNATNIPHYGIRFYIKAPMNSNAPVPGDISPHMTVTCTANYYMCFKGVH